jgi:trehalose 6-phosphate synthase/phosphatase
VTHATARHLVIEPALDRADRSIAAHPTTRQARQRRVILVSNRLPVTARMAAGEVRLTPSSGGLATGLRGVHAASGGWWIGWNGCTDALGAEAAESLDGRLAEMRAASVPLSPGEVIGFYEGYANGVLWPLCHYFIDQLPLVIEGWDDYVRVNERFAEAAVAHAAPGDAFWVHDYHLMLVPEMIRQRMPNARIGYFQHIPFPSSELFSSLPEREALLRGLLGADVVGFHTESYVHHFGRATERLLGLPLEGGTVRVGMRRVEVGAFPMGIDVDRFAATARDPRTRLESKLVRRSTNVTLFLGVDRLDYTKGIPRRLLAFERMLERHPELCERVRLVQVAVPSRASVRGYEAFRQQVDGLVGRINGRFGSAGWTPVHYLYRSVTEKELVALYLAADVMLVTPVRDGMNLVAKEFVACRDDEDGVLVLSEFAGAACELGGALLVNPYDVDGTAEAYHTALTMPEKERAGRMRALRARVMANDVKSWAEGFLERV